MRKIWSVLLLSMTATAYGASFDCTKATTPQEKAICSTPALSTADDELAAAWKVAVAASPAEMIASVRDDQRAWVRGTALSCPGVGKANVARLKECLAGRYQERTKQLKGLVVQLGGVTFVGRSVSRSVKDKPQPGDEPCLMVTVPGSSTLTASWPQSSSDAPEWKSWNLALEAATRKLAQADKPGPVATWEAALSGMEDDDNDLAVSLRSVGKDLVTASIESFEMGHCSAHPNNVAQQFNWLLPEQRELTAKDVFRAGSGWEKKLEASCRNVLIPQIRKNGGAIADDNVLKALPKIVIDPHNWQIEAKGLSIVFSDGDDLSHAEVPDPISIPWATLKPLLQTTFPLPQ